MLAVLEVGGTHVTSALVDPAELATVRSERMEIDSSADSVSLIDVFASAVERLNTRVSRLVVAIPGPFDYERGVGGFEGVEKFGSLRGICLGDELAARLGCRVRFLNDVTAYAMGEYLRLQQPRRLVALTLGTGVGSAFLLDGHPVEEGPLVPQHGWAYTLEHGGRPIEESFSRRAIISAYIEAAGASLEKTADVEEIACLALAGNPVASAVFKKSYGALAAALAPWLVGFRTEVLVLGGSISQAWELVDRWFLPEIRRHFERYRSRTPEIVTDENGEEAALIGAALYARSLR